MTIYINRQEEEFCFIFKNGTKQNNFLHNKLKMFNESMYFFMLKQTQFYCFTQVAKCWRRRAYWQPGICGIDVGSLSLSERSHAVWLWIISLLSTSPQYFAGQQVFHTCSGIIVSKTGNSFVFFCWSQWLVGFKLRVTAAKIPHDRVAFFSCDALYIGKACIFSHVNKLNIITK